jgi:hypothetical protein
MEESRRNIDAKYMRLRHLTAELRGKDLDMARTLEDRMRIIGDMLVVGGAAPQDQKERDYLSLARERAEEDGGYGCTKEQLLPIVEEAARLASVVFNPGASLSRSVSSVGERQTTEFGGTMSLPQRAETFGGFDQQLIAKAINVDGSEQLDIPSIPSASAAASSCAPPLLQMEPEQQEAAVNLVHCLNTIQCMVSEHFTSLER